MLPYLVVKSHVLNLFPVDKHFKIQPWVEALVFMVKLEQRCSEMIDLCCVSLISECHLQFFKGVQHFSDTLGAGKGCNTSLL